jgi:hypothetical protein
MTMTDEYDEAVFLQGILLSAAVRRFLARFSTLKVIAAGLLDEDVVAELRRCSKAMWDVRVQRIEAARAKTAADELTAL